MPFSLTQPQKDSLGRFLERRNLKEGVIAFFAKTIEENNLKRGQLTQDKNATYERLVSDLESAIKEDWATEDELIELLDNSEVAGRQHVCIYEIKPANIESTMNAIRQPGNRSDDSSSLDGFGNYRNLHTPLYCVTRRMRC